jgi:hypothetical protein
LDGAIVHDAVRRADGEAVPLGPPTARGVPEGTVGRVLGEEVYVIGAGRGGVRAVGV